MVVRVVMVVVVVVMMMVVMMMIMMASFLRSCCVSSFGRMGPTRRHCISGCEFLGTQFDIDAQVHRCCKRCQESHGEIHGLACRSLRIDATLAWEAPAASSLKAPAQQVVGSSRSSIIASLKPITEISNAPFRCAFAST